MNKRKIAVVVGVLFVFIVGLAIGLGMNRDKNGSSPIAEETQASEKNPSVTESIDIGKPSEGTTHIEQKIDPVNPYSASDERAIENFAKTKEALLIGELFDNLNSPQGTQINADLTGIELGAVKKNTTISTEFEGMLWGYRWVDEHNKLLFDGNVLKNFQPHNSLLMYLQMLRPTSKVVLERVGKILPKPSSDGSFMTTLKPNGEEESYLIQKMSGMLLLKQTIDSNIKYYTAEYNLYIAIPRGTEAASRPYYIWHDQLNVDVNPIEETELDQNKKMFLGE